MKNLTNSGIIILNQTETVRSQIVSKKDFRKLMRVTGRQYSNLIRFATTTEKPVISLSYEKAISEPETFIESLIGFLNIQVSPEQKAAAMNAVAPNNPKYQVHTFKQAQKRKKKNETK